MNNMRFYFKNFMITSGVKTALSYARNPFIAHPRMSFIFDSSRDATFNEEIHIHWIFSKRGKGAFTIRKVYIVYFYLVYW